MYGVENGYTVWRHYEDKKDAIYMANFLNGQYHNGYYVRDLDRENGDDNDKEQKYNLEEAEPVAYDSGGGIIVCEMELYDQSVALIEDEYECLSIFKKPEDGELYFLSENMTYSEGVEEMDEYHAGMYDKMRKVLDKYLEEWT